MSCYYASMTIVVAGGSGFIGTALVQTLLSKGHTVVVIDRVGPRLTHKQLFFIPCDLEHSVLPFNVLERTDAIINLVGRPIVGRWNETVKKQIRDSRVLSTKNLIESLRNTVNRPQIFINASAVGFYGDCEESPADEHTPSADTFLATVVKEWEQEALQAEEYGCRTVIIRTATVLGKRGFLASFLKMARFHILFQLSKKPFFLPWIHINDLVRTYLFAIETTTLQGTVNAVAPVFDTSDTIIRTLARKTKSLVLGAIPLRRFFFGELITEITRSQKVAPQRLLDKGFEFAFTDVDTALSSVLYEKN